MRYVTSDLSTLAKRHASELTRRRTGCKEKDPECLVFVCVPAKQIHSVARSAHSLGEVYKGILKTVSEHLPIHYGMNAVSTDATS